MSDHSQVAGPSRPRAQSQVIPLDDDDVPLQHRSTAAAPAAVVQAPDGEASDEDEERMDVTFIQSFASKIQHLPTGSDVDGSAHRAKIIVPKRGEKDFEPMEETVNLQDMMLQRSREALFNALVGVRGGNVKSISQAVLYVDALFPRLLSIRGHLLDRLGISVRYPPSVAFDKARTFTELLPEEALYLLERGSLQIWVGPEAQNQADVEQGLGEWSEEDHGVKGAIEMSVQEGFARFIGQEGLTWERYQAYAYLRRLGYTVYRTRQFLPRHCLESVLDHRERHVSRGASSREEPFRTWWLSIPGWIGRLLRWAARGFWTMPRRIHQVGLGMRDPSRRPIPGSLVEKTHFSSYPNLLEKLRVIATGHSLPLPGRATASIASNLYEPLTHNPYLPFFHVWKPNTPWSKNKWDKGSVEGLGSQPPDYVVAVVNSRRTPMPTIHQLDEVFSDLPDEPLGPPRRKGPQYDNKTRGATHDSPRPERSFWNRLQSALGFKRMPDKQTNFGSLLGQLRTGDRAFIVAVNDSGNTGWVRFGRSGFAGAALL